MHEQVNCEQSYVSLSAFLCLDNKNQREKTHSFTNNLAIDSTVLNPSMSEIICDPISRSEISPESQDNLLAQLLYRQKKQKKEYSKNYRKKQKDYVQNLKMMNEKYERRIEELTLKVEQMSQEIRCLKYGKQISKDNLFDSTFIKEKQQSLKQLVNEAEQKKQTTWEELKEFNFVYGFAGKQKINLLNYYMSQIIQHLLIDHNKNFVMNGLEDFQLSRPFAKRLEEIQLELLEYTSSDTIQLRKFLKRLMPETLKKFHKCGQEFYQSYVNLISQAKAIQNQLSNIEEGLFRLLSADKYLAVLRWYEENKHSREIQQMRKEWFQSFRKK